MAKKQKDMNNIQTDNEKPVTKKAKKVKMDLLSKIILIVSIITFLGSGGYLVYKYFGEPFLEQMELASYKKDYKSEDPATADNGVWEDTDEQKEEERLPDGTLASFKTIRELNGDVVGWITVPNTLIDYPVVQTTNNTFYLRHNINKQYNYSGCPFLDYRNSINPENRSRSLLIYGHHRRNGTMFAKLTNYNDVDFYKENPVIRFDTIYERGEWVIFSNFRATTKSSTGRPFNYLKTEFDSDEDFLSFVDDLKKRSLIDTTVEIRADDQILLLSTCSYEKSGWRMVIAARRLRPGENKIDVSGAAKARNPLMP